MSAFVLDTIVGYNTEHNNSIFVGGQKLRIARIKN